MSEVTPIQDRLLDTEYIPQGLERNTLQKEGSHGNRISPSQIETLSKLYETYNESEDDISFLTELSRIKDTTNRQEVLKNAKWSIYGTQIHNLTYFTQIFERAKSFGRNPILSDFKYTFPFRNEEYYLGLSRILDLTDFDSENPSQSFWNEWRMNGQDFTPKKSTSYLIHPNEIKMMWENGTVPLKDIDEFHRSFNVVDRRKLDPIETLVLNEVVTITNIYFNDSNLQVPTVIDEICIPRDFPNEPIQIIDYKTGKQFKQPEYKEKVQIFLMMTAVLANVLDKVNCIKFKCNEWDIAHDTFEFPFFTKKNLRNNFISGIFFDDLQRSSDIFNSSFLFSYIDPITQRRIDITPQQLGIGTDREIKQMLMYLYSLNNFYSLHKEVLKRQLKKSKSVYTLPSFPSKDFDNPNVSGKVVQLGLI